VNVNSQSSARVSGGFNTTPPNVFLANISPIPEVGSLNIPASSMSATPEQTIPENEAVAVTFILELQELAFGISFQLPLVMYAATASGITEASFWRKNIRYAIVVIVIFGAVVTPDGSGVTMWFIGGPMIALYVAGMFFVERKERQIRTLKSQT